ncbi:MAG TPA: hypothetical protein VK477_08480, partial [Acidobacteriota bacterium]|nr:hypothetical protein [Acidobacteriota bacterium]
MKSHSLRRRVGWALVGTIASMAFATESPVADGAIYELPKYTVKNPLELPAPESWRYARIPGFEVLSNASDAATQRFLKDFQMMQQVLDITWPVLRRAGTPLPTTLILTTGGQAARDFLRPAGRLVGDIDVFEFQEFDPSDPLQSTRRINRVSSRMFSNEEQACIVLNLADDGAGNADPYRRFYDQYLRYLISRFEAPSPPWLVEGVASLFAGIDYTDKWIEFGVLGRRDDDFNQLLTPKPPESAGDGLGTEGASPPPLQSRLGKFPSLAAMLVADEEQLRADARLRVLAQAFVHMCLYGRGLKYQKPLFTYLRRVRGGPGTEAIVRECFGMTIAQLQDEIQGYSAFTDYRRIQFRAQKGRRLVPTQDVVLRPATPAEIGRIKGDGLLLAGNRDAAFLELLAPYVRKQHDNDLLASLALLELRSESNARAQRGRKLLEAAVADGTARARAYLELARLNVGEQVGPMDEVRRAQVLAWARKAASLPPPLLGAYELLAALWWEADGKPPAEDLVLLEQGVRRFPGNLALVYRTARLCADGGRVG